MDRVRTSLPTALGLAALLIAASPSAKSQSPAGSFQLGPGYVYPEVEVAAQRDDNIALAPESGRVADTIRYVRPALRIDGKSGARYYDAGYKGEYARYNSVATDNYENHEVFAAADLAFGARNDLKLKAQYVNKVDRRGTLGIVTPTPSEYVQSSFAALYAYGAPEAAGKLELQAGGYSKEYQNNRQQTAELDHARTDLGATLLMRVQPKTQGSLTARHYRFDYAEAGSPKDSRETSVFAGLRWNVTDLTYGKLSIGYVTKKFEAGASPGGEFSGAGWEGSIGWKPLAHSSFEFITHKRPMEATGIGDFLVNQASQLTWTHAWGSRISTVLAAGHSKDSYSDAPVASSGGADRRDVTRLGSVRALYAVQRWLKIGAEYIGSVRDSNDDAFEYRRNQTMLLASLSL